MEFAIIQSPTAFSLHGKSSTVKNQNFGEVGMKLMDEMWRVVKQTRTETTGINHWVYLADGRMFVGVELIPSGPAPAELEPLQFELNRFLKHIHVGSYQTLPAKWNELRKELASRNESVGEHSLEIYGHHCEDPSKQETTILIGLLPTSP
jgi:hypothetical protein